MQAADINWDTFLRGAVAGLLIFHLVNLALPGARASARAALAAFTLALLAYLFCQQADVLLGFPRPLAVLALALCAATTAWMWLAARALFTDHFVISLPVITLPAAMTALGLAAHLPHLDAAREGIADPGPSFLVVVHAIAMLAFTAVSLLEIVNGWRDDLVQPRRVARRWAALGIGVYAALALVIELAVRGQPIGRLLPALHVAGIGCVTFALAILVARRSLNDVLGLPESESALGSVALVAVVHTSSAAAAEPPIPSPAIARVQQAMTEEHLYRREGLTPAALAQALGLGEAALRTLINQELGYRNFNDFLHHYRLQEASARLVGEDLPVLTIALECGYGSIGPFNRAFKQRMGMTPSEYRGAARLSERTAKN